MSGLAGVRQNVGHREPERHSQDPESSPTNITLHSDNSTHSTTTIRRRLAMKDTVQLIGIAAAVAVILAMIALIIYRLKHGHRGQGDRSERLCHRDYSESWPKGEFPILPHKRLPYFN